MTHDAAHDPVRQNRAIWSHYQSSETSVFARAKPRLDRVARELTRRVGAHASVLTIGVGDGYLERTLRSRGMNAHALDPDPEAIARLQSEGIAASTGVIESLPFGDRSFEAVAASEVFEHLTDEQRETGLAELGRVLMPGGWLVGTVPYRENLDEQRVACPDCGAVFHRWGHVCSFDEARITEELSPHFVVTHIDHRAFVEFRGRSIKRLVSGAAVWVMGRLGMAPADPHIFFVARRR